MVRDEELNRLIKYAEGMNIKVSFKRENTDSVAYWFTDGSGITINTKYCKTKTLCILALIHELGHHLQFIYDKERKPDESLNNALDRHEQYEYNIIDTPAPKAMRKKILDDEREGAKWWETIYNETDMKFPIWRLHAEKEFDLWKYEVFYETGHFPKGKARSEKYKEIKRKWKNK